MAEDVDDEAVLFEGSPLLDHLQEVGATDGVLVGTKTANDGEHTWRSLAPAAKSWLLERWMNVSSPFHNLFYYLARVPDANNDIIDTLMHSSLLSQDDKNLLLLFDEDVFAKRTAMPSSSSLSKTSTGTETETLRYTRYMSVPLVIAVLSLLLVADTLTLLLAALLALAASAMLATDMLVWQVSTTVTEWRRASEQLNTALKRSLRLMQDIEVVHHGFLRPSLGTSSGRRDGSLFASASLTCTALEKTVRISSLRTYYQLRQLTRTFVERFPLLGHIDSVDHYLCYVDLDIPSETDLTQEELSCTKVEGALPKCTHSTLKMYVNLLRNQQSECVRRLLIYFATKASGHVVGIWTYVSLWHLIHDSVCTVKAQQRQLQASLDYMQSRLSDPPRPADLSHAETVASTRFSQLSYLAHTLQLHLHTALERSGSLRSALSSPAEITDTEINEEFVNSLQAHLSLINVSVSSSESYVGDISSSLTQMVQAANAPSHAAEDGSDEEEDSMLQEADPTPTSLAVRSSDSEDDEKVYEATVDSSDESEDELRKVTPAERRAEMERQRKEAEEPLRMVKELKAVLASRQANAVLRRSGKVKKSVEEDAAEPSPSSTVPGPTGTPPGGHLGPMMKPEHNSVLLEDELKQIDCRTASDSPVALQAGALSTSARSEEDPTGLAVSHRPEREDAGGSHGPVVLCVDPQPEQANLPFTSLQTSSSSSSGSMARMAAMMALQARSTAGLGAVETFGSGDDSDDSDGSDDDV